jgi:hypothetical protein
MCPATLMVVIGRGLAVGLVAASLGGCVTSNVPLLSNSQAILIDSIPGDYASANGNWRVTLEGRTYRLVDMKSKEDAVISLQKFDDQFTLAQVKGGLSTVAYHYWLMYVGSTYVLINEIPCNATIKNQAGVQSDADDNSCNLHSDQDVIAIARIAAQRYLADQNAITPVVKIKM